MKLNAEEIFGRSNVLKEDKTNTLVEMLVKYVNNAKENDILPNKKEVSSYLNVSMGTVQNAYRILEDKGLVQSKQRIGTIVTSRSFKKQTSKRDCCINAIRNYIDEKNIYDVSKLPSIRTLSKELKFPVNTVNSALKSIQNGASSKESNDFSLVQKIEKELEQYIIKNCEIGDNIPSLKEFSKELNVSIKTVNDAVKNLADKRILTPHRGKYGTTVINIPGKIKCRKEDLIFAPAKDVEFYFYEKVQGYIKQLIIKGNCEVGSKLPSIKELSLLLNVNSNTVRRALKNLEEEGYVTFERGRYGGTFITNIPDANTYKWLALDPKYVAVYN